MDLSRSEALLGTGAMKRLGEMEVAVIGVGGVGSWCAEALVRTGLKRIRLIDDDVVAPSNVNRQCPAMADTVGRAKVEVMKERLLAINPECEVRAEHRRFTDWENFEKPDFIVDAIDSVDCKARLILGANAAGVPIVSSLGAAKRFDPTKVAVRRFDRIEGDGLARALRRLYRSNDIKPLPKSLCVYSLEPPQPIETLGSLMPVTCAFGMALAAEVIKFVRCGADAGGTK